MLCVAWAHALREGRAGAKLHRAYQSLSHKQRHLRVVRDVDVASGVASGAWGLSRLSFQHNGIPVESSSQTIREYTDLNAGGSGSVDGLHSSGDCFQANPSR